MYTTFLTRLWIRFSFSTVLTNHFHVIRSVFISPGTYLPRSRYDSNICVFLFNNLFYTLQQNHIQQTLPKQTTTFSHINLKLSIFLWHPNVRHPVHLQISSLALNNHPKFPLINIPKRSKIVSLSLKNEQTVHRQLPISPSYWLSFG